jgi:hypothetical protein
LSQVNIKIIGVKYFQSDSNGRQAGQTEAEDVFQSDGFFVGVDQAEGLFGQGAGDQPFGMGIK